MITLRYGPATIASYNNGLFGAHLKNSLVVCPNEESLRALTHRVSGLTGMPVNCILQPVATVLDTLFRESDDRTRRLSGPSELLLIRNILEQSPEKFDYLTGKNSIPRLTYAALRRIASSLDRLRSVPEGIESSYSRTARWKQLGELLDFVNSALQKSGRQLERFYFRQKLSRLDRSTWESRYPDIERVLFLDFSDFDDTTLFLINSVSRHVDACDVLLDYFQTPTIFSPALDSSLQLLTDMADDVIFEVGGADAEGGAEAAILVNAATVKSEVESMVQFVSRITSSVDAASSRVMLALANFNEYILPVENCLQLHQLNFVTERRIRLLDTSLWSFLEVLSACTNNGVTCKNVAALLRSPGFVEMLEIEQSSVDGWDIASQLEEVYNALGDATGWKEINRALLHSLETDSRRRMTNPSQDLYTARCVAATAEIMQAIKRFLSHFDRSRTVGEWSRKIGEYVAGQFDNYTNADPLLAKLLKTLIADLHDENYWFSGDKEAKLSFSRFLRQLKTLMYDKAETNLDEMLNADIAACHIDTATLLSADCCIVLGGNDGSFPRFKKPAPEVLEQNGPAYGQIRISADQYVILSKLFRNYGRLLFCRPELNGLERLLPSQFLEALRDSKLLITTTCAELLDTVQGGTVGSNTLPLLTQAVMELKGLVLDESELDYLCGPAGLTRRAFEAVSVTNARASSAMTKYDGIITDETLKGWVAEWSARHIYSVAQLDSAIGCVFRFYADRILNLEESGSSDDLLSPHVFGSITHNVLATFYRKWMSDKGSLLTPGQELSAREGLVQAYDSELATLTSLPHFANDLLELKLFGGAGKEAFRHKYEVGLTNVNWGVLGQFLEMEMQRGTLMSVDGFIPSHFEIGFGMGKVDQDESLSVAHPLSLNLGDKTVIQVRGRIDRIDISADGTFAVTDYKTGRIPDKKHVLEGYKAQLPIYLLVGEQLFLLDGNQSAEMAGGLYYSLRNDGKDKVSGILLRSRFQSRLGISGRSALTDDTFSDALETVKLHTRNSVTAIANGFFIPTWRNEDIVCAYCPFEQFCYRNVEKNRRFAAGVGMLGEGSAW